MTKKELLKQTLLNTGYFLDNKYLDDYLNLVLLNAYAGTEYSETHHILQRAYFKQLALPVNQTKQNKVRLLYKDHCYAHYLLYFCTIGFLKQANFAALKTLWNMSNTYSIKAQTLKNVSEADFNFLQLRMNEIAEDPDNVWWSQQELAILLKYYPIEGSKVSLRLQNRSKYSCHSKAKELGISHSVEWTEDELTILKESYPSLGPIKTSELLPKRSADAVRRMAANLGIKNTAHYWSDEELEILKYYYPLEDSKVVKRLPHRNKTDCLKKARELGLYSRRYWTQEEIDILIQYYPAEGSAVFKRISKDAAACRQKANSLGLHTTMGRKI